MGFTDTDEADDESCDRTPAWMRFSVSLVCAWIALFMIGVGLQTPTLLFSLWGFVISLGLGVCGVVAYEQTTGLLVDVVGKLFGIRCDRR